MAFFGDDMFDRIVREMERNGMGGDFEEYPTENGRRRVSKRVFDGSSNNYIQTPKNVFLVLDLSGKKVVDVNTKKNPQKDPEESDKVLEIVLSDNEKVNYMIPKEAKANKFDWNFTNGILEVKFKK